ncbi:uncharacterized protein LOC123706734 [Pieris brassicae]|uniref:Uncharacterized protein n=1 Tax=Pieris brassicae TaxID=7116 RepID=A0A9P0X8T5_PIEBR|nr:uncharacterized protein LOC123706734 [Pieris brassicae]CAH4017822.1 unnamed protein product [Pieris brassicae]
MSFPKFFGFILITLGLIRAEDLHTSAPLINDGLKGNCSCGGFPTSTPEPNTEPLLSQSPGLVVNCDEEGSTKCKVLCNAIATAAKAKGPEILCNRLKNADELKLSAFFKICEKPWVYADMTADENLCCQDAEVKTCASADHLTTMTNKE